jgi:hypothetical protein
MCGGFAPRIDRRGVSSPRLAASGACLGTDGLKLSSNLVNRPRQLGLAVPQLLKILAGTLQRPRELLTRQPPR